MAELGFFALVHLALVVYALIQIFGSSADTGSKILGCSSWGYSRSLG